MIFVREVMLLIAIIIIVAIIGGKVHGAEIDCYHNVAELRAEHPGGAAVWTKRAPGHTGEKCWFPSRKEVVRVAVGRQTIGWLNMIPAHYDQTSMQAPTPSASVGVPLPKPNVKKEFDEFLSAQSHIEETWWILTRTARGLQ